MLSSLAHKTRTGAVQGQYIYVCVGTCSHVYTSMVKYGPRTCPSSWLLVL